MLLQQHSRAPQILRMHHVEPCVDAQGGQFFQGVTRDLCPSIVEHHLAGLDIPLPGAYPGALDDVREAPALQGQFFLLVLALGDVGMGSGHAVGLAGGVANRHAPGQYPAPGTILVVEAEFQAVGWGLPAQVGLDGGIDPWGIVGMEQACEGSEMVFQFVVPVAHHLLPAGRKIRFVGAQVPIPYPVVGTGDGQLVSLPGIPDVRLGLTDGGRHAVEGFYHRPQFGTAQGGQLHVILARRHGLGA